MGTPLDDVLERAAAGWRDGDAAAVGDCFAETLDYIDPVRYRFRAGRTSCRSSSRHPAATT